MTKRIAAIGDLHGCIDEFYKLLKMLEHHSLDEIWHLGDLVDRGPDSGGVVEVCRKRRIRGVMGNHDAALLSFRPHPNTERHERYRSYNSIRSEDDWRYLERLPYLHVDDELELVFVHGGIWNGIPLERQPKAVNHAQMIEPWNPHKTKFRTEWWGEPDEDELREKGWRRWYEVCDVPHTVAYGHSVFPEPFVFNRTVGLDTGCVFGGSLTAMIFPSRETLQVKADRVYYERRKRGVRHE